MGNGNGYFNIWLSLPIQCLILEALSSSNSPYDSLDHERVFLLWWWSSAGCFHRDKWPTLKDKLPKWKDQSLFMFPSQDKNKRKCKKAIYQSSQFCIPLNISLNAKIRFRCLKASDFPQLLTRMQVLHETEKRFLPMN